MPQPLSNAPLSPGSSDCTSCGDAAPASWADWARLALGRKERRLGLGLRRGLRRGLGLTLAAAAGLGLSVPTAATAQESELRSAPPGMSLPIREHTLANGMKLLILPRPGAPVISAVVQFNVGGVNEVLGRTGIAHLLEHMLFKGSSRLGTTNAAAERALFEQMDARNDTIRAERAAVVPDSARISRLTAEIGALEDSARAHVVPNEFERTLSRAGARGLNATTTNEATIYFVEFPANRLELWFALEAERMSDPVFREFYAERDVVTEERRMRIENNPFGRLYETHLDVAWSVHPYGVPVVGYMTDLENLTRDQVAEYYRRYYGARNAVVTLVGDLDPDDAVAMAEQWFGPLAAGEVPPPVLAVEPPQRGERRVSVEYDAEPALRLGWHVPGVLHEDAAALTMLTSLLTGGRTASLYRRLVQDERIATSVLSSMGPGERYPRLFMLDAVPRSPTTTAELEAVILDEVERLKVELFPEDALQRVRNQIAAGSIRRLQSNLGLAFQLAGAESVFGDWRVTFTLADAIRDVTAEDVRRVVERYLTPDNLSVATLVRPEGAR